MLDIAPYCLERSAPFRYRRCAMIVIASRKSAVAAAAQIAAC